jgi:uncharacterized membrane protein HdeD (DUF308 family)
MRFNLAPRAAVMLALGFYITFKQGRGITWAIGILVWLGIGLAAAVLGPLLSKRARVSYSKSWLGWIPEFVLAIGIATAASMNPFGNESGGYNYFMALVTIFGFCHAAICAVQAFLARGNRQDRTDAITSGVLSLALGVLYATAPLGAIPAVGFLGAYLVIMGVNLGISAATVRKG